ncbi:MAG: ABC transporter ATP-binding protein [Deltaproteobacteria bacterium]|nr:MAG: hypothetical protein B6U90_03835 [Thermoplasmatales archaeon ex4484_6]RLB21273.1 MAG: ABC transporter ATP-binding protein [Deltaproteobacteria bacterium]RLF66763.1 MAG: ABC transporter ATP-binding protein [Thermoplasmata archaeon]
MTLEVVSVGFGYGGSVPVLKDVSISVGDGEVYTLLGSSGSGKTTLLNIIAGFLRPDSGRVMLDGEDITHIRPERRGVGMVFQDYALFPHMNVRNNILFPMKARNLARAEMDGRADELCELVGISHLRDRMPSELSGGEKQRTAIARALAADPRVLLLDEPLSALDAALRIELRGELRSLLSSLEVPTLYITHDQREAMAISDRIGYLLDGRIIEEGTPEKLYWRPERVQTASFLGFGNIFRVKARGNGSIATPLGPIPWNGDMPSHIGFRPDSVRIGTDGGGLKGKVISSEYRGSSLFLRVSCRSVVVIMEVDPHIGAGKGDEVTFSIPRDSIVPLR